MEETILNIFLEINSGYVEQFRAKAYVLEGSDDEKISYLLKKAKTDFDNSYKFDAPTNSAGKFMPYRSFSKLEKAGRHFELFEEIFTKFNVPENPLICVTPVVDGELLAK